MIIKRKLVLLMVPMLAALAFHTLLAVESAGVPSTSKPSQRSTPSLVAKSTARPAAVAAAVPRSPITFSITSSLRCGKLVVSLDGVPVFNEEFRKPPFLIFQTTRWDPLQVTAGKHRLTAKVYGAKGKTFLSGVYDLEVSRTKGIELRFRTKADGLTVEPAS